MANTKSILGGIRDKLVAQIKESIVDGKAPPWVRPWKKTGQGGMPRNGLTGKAYHGVNIIILASEYRGDARWYTFNQAKEAAGYRKNPEWKGKADTYKGVAKWLWKGEGEDPKVGSVRKGEKGTQILLWKPTKKYKKTVEVDGRQEEQERQGFYCTTFAVFNHEQIDWPQESAEPVEAPAERDVRVETALEEVSRQTSLQGGLEHGGDRAYYSIAADAIRLPKRAQFESFDAYAATRAHEFIHATGHESRLAREFGKRFGDDAYAFEELVAEMGAAFLCAHLGIDGKLQHASYLAHWVEILEGDDYALLTAAKRAEEAFNWLTEERQQQAAA